MTIRSTSASSSDAAFDVIVVGAGIAGWTAARRSQQLGASVAMLERGPTGPSWGCLRQSQGRYHAAHLNPRTSPPDVLYERIMARTGGHARPDVARAWADNTNRALDFLVTEGAEVEPDGPADYMQNDMQWKRAPVLAKMWETFVGSGGTFRPNARAVRLETQGGAVVGVHIERPDGSRELVRGRAVILAGSGFQSNDELVRKYVTRHSYRPLGHHTTNGNSYNTGDCLLMAIAAGAKLVEMDAFYGTVGFRDGLTNEKLTGGPTELIEASIVVNGNGERVGDEAVGPEMWSPSDLPIARDIAETDAPGDSWVVFDHLTWETDGRSDEHARRRLHNGAATTNPLIVERGGTLLVADSIAELARQADLPADRLQKTVDAFNRFCKDGTPLTPPRNGHPKPILQAPFHAIPLLVALYFTMGGPLVNGHGQVLNERELVIPGLYAAGSTMGGLQGGPRNGYAGGWSAASTFGLLSAEHAVSQARVGVAAGAR